MNTTLESKLILGGIIFLMLFGSAAPVQAQVSSTRLEAGGNPIFPLLGLISSWFRRNRTYTNADDFITDQKNQYAEKLKTLEQQKAKGTIFTGKGSDPEAQEAAFVVVKAMIEQEQKQMTDFAEGIKKQARHDFNQAVKKQIVNLVMSAGFVQNILGAINTGVGQAQNLVNGAISALSGAGPGDIASQIRGLNNFANELQAVGSMIGGDTGENLRSSVQDILAKINSPIDQVKENLNDIQSSLTDVQSQIQDLMAKGYLPTTSGVAQSAVLQLVGLGSGDETTEALLTLLGVKGGTSPEAIRSRAETLLAAGETIRCQKWGKNWKVAIQAMKDIQALQYANDAPESDCTPIDPSDLVASTSGEPSTTTGNNQGKSVNLDCDASSLISVSSGGVTWSTDGQNKCYEDLTFHINSGTSESVVIFVHEVTTGEDADDRWAELGVGGQENYNYPGDQKREYTEFIAFYNDNSCLAAGKDPAHAGLPIVPIPSHCP